VAKFAPLTHANESEHRRLIAQRANLSVTEEAGTWQPTVSFSTPGDLSVSYSIRVGRYTKVGTLTHLVVDLLFTPTYTTASGNLTITLPFAVSAAPGLGVVGGSVVPVTLGSVISTAGVASGSPVSIQINVVAG
jgi:hypothetical protein